MVEGFSVNAASSSYSCKTKTLSTGEGAAEATGACGNSATCGLTGLLAVDVPLDGRGPTALPAAEMMSPVFTLWITLVAMYLGAALAGGVAPACAFRALCFLLLMRAHRECRRTVEACTRLCT